MMLGLELKAIVGQSMGHRMARDMAINALLNETAASWTSSRHGFNRIKAANTRAEPSRICAMTIGSKVP
jgi:hypothetical protein